MDLPEPIPVYIAYFTARAVGSSKVAFARDAYGRDTPLRAAMASRERPRTAIQLAAR